MLIPPVGDEFVQLTSNLTFTNAAPAQTNFILFRIIDDDLEEPPEEFFISVGLVTATITIIDDDGEFYQSMAVTPPLFMEQY